MRSTGWRKRWAPYTGAAKGTFIQGDPKVPATRWWNHLWLLWWGWKTVVVFEVQRPHAAFQYRIGFRNTWGKAYLLDRSVVAPRIAMRIGREDCHFFAVDMHGNDEFPLTLVERTHRKDPRFAAVPLY